MNILMVTPFFLPPKGGLGYHVQGLSKSLVHEGHKITVVTPASTTVHKNDNGREIFTLKSFYLPGWPYHSLESFSIPYRPWALFSLIKRLIKEYKFDLLHAHGQKYLCTWIAVDMAFRAKLPCVLTIHGTYGLRYYSHIANSVEEVFNSTVLKRTLRKTSAVICPTQIEEKYARRYCESINCFKIPNGVNVAEFQDALKYKQRYREEYSIPLDRKVVLFVGRFTHVKGIIELMEAIGHVTKIFPKAFFVIVGDGPLRENVERLARSQKENVRILKWVPHSEMYKVYALSDIFVLPSRSEGQPVTIIEAMASQLYIVSTIVGGVPDTLAGYKHKVYVEQVSPTGISNGILKALKDFSERRAFDNEVLPYIGKFDWLNIGKEIERVYNHVIHE